MERLNINHLLTVSKKLLTNTSDSCKRGSFDSYERSHWLQEMSSILSLISSSPILDRKKNNNKFRDDIKENYWDVLNYKEYKIFIKDFLWQNNNLLISQTTNRSKQHETVISIENKI